MRIFIYSLLLLVFLTSCKENNNEELIRETWRITVTETKPLRISFTQQNRILNEIYGNISEFTKEQNRSKFDSVKMLRSKIIKESERSLIQLRRQSKTEENGKMITATINLLVSLIEVENALPNIYGKVEKNIDNKATPRNEKFLEVVNRYEKNGENYDTVKNEYYEKNKNALETSL
jgi:hypothetical protein